MYTKEIFEDLVVPRDAVNASDAAGQVKGERVEALYRTLKSDLLCAKFEPGERLIEERLTERYGLTSRTLVREVLARLKSEGHVSVRGRSFISPNHPAESLLQLYDVRLSLEILAAQGAACNSEPSDLRACLKRIADAQQRGNAVEVNAADVLFHLKIAEMSRNEVLMDVLSHIHEKVFQIRNLFFTEESTREEVVAEHHILLIAIERGVPEVAVAEMSHHLSASRKKFKDKLN